MLYLLGMEPHAPWLPAMELVSGRSSWRRCSCSRFAAPQACLEAAQDSRESADEMWSTVSHRLFFPATMTPIS